MRILFFTHYFAPEVNAPANRTHEHCREWVAAGHDVHVITCTPSHPAGVPFAGYGRPWYRHEVIDGIHVHRVWTYLAPNRGVARRTINYLSFIPTAVSRALNLGTFDLAIGTSPQFFCAVATWLYARITSVPWIFELRDLWPDSIPAVGAIRRSFLLRRLERIELRMYRDATAIVCVTRAFMATLVSRGVAAQKLAFVPNGVLPEFWQTGSRVAGRQELGIAADEVLVSYVGTIGMAHGLDITLRAAEQLLTTAPLVRFAIVGDGAELDRMRAIAAERRLTNVAFTGLVSRTGIPSLMAATDIALVTLRPSEVFRTVLPSKMFEAMAAARPIVMAVDGEARATLDRAGAGVYVPPGDADALAQAIKRLANDRAQRDALGEAGARFVAREFSRTVWAQRYLEMLKGVASDRRNTMPSIVGKPAVQ